MYSSGKILGLSPAHRQDAVLVLLAAMLGVCLLPCPAGAKYDGGAGTEASPYIIRTADHMHEIANSPADWDKHFRLAADVDMNDVNEYSVESFSMIGTSSTQPFRGIFDGSGHTISNLNLATTEPLCTGLFGCVGGEVRNLGLIKPVVNAQGSRVGALVGYLDQGQVTRCYARNARVSGGDDVGGLIGRNAGRIFTSYSSGNVSGEAFVGGLVGLLTDGTVNTSFSKADVSGNRNVGGLVGKASDEIAAVTHSYAAGSVTGDSYVGGLVGQVERGAAYKSYSVGSVSGNEHVGGLTGYVRVLGRVSNSLWDTETSGQPASAGGTAKTTAEMKTISTFTDQGWDFWNTWTMCEGTNYPTLLWQIPVTDYRCPDGVDFIDFAFFAARWHQEGCTPANGNCEGTDVDGSGTVDFLDFEIFAKRWMEGVQ